MLPSSTNQTGLPVGVTARQALEIGHYAWHRGQYAVGVEWLSAAESKVKFQNDTFSGLTEVKKYLDVAVNEVWNINITF